MRFLLRLAESELPKERFLAAVKSLARSIGCDPRNPKWTSRGALEIDIFCPRRSDFDLFLSALEPLYPVVFSRDLNSAPPHMDEDELFKEARGYFNDERYWECHEVLEGIWRTKQGVEKLYLQGLILVCAAYVHHQKGEPEVAMNVLKRARAQLGYPEPRYHGISVGATLENVDGAIRTGTFGNFRI